MYKHISPIGTGANHVLVTLQDFRSSFNTFTWAGGYRYAGVAQNQEAAGKEVDVIRAGISSAHDRLIPGFSYYGNNIITVGVCARARACVCVCV